MALSKEDYLKRYLSPEKKKKPRKQKSLKVKHVISRIVDDDVTLEMLENQDKAVEEDEDEAPTIADFVDERPEHIQQLEQFRQDDRWKVLDDQTAPSSRLHDSGSDQSPVSSRRHDSDSDQSPPRSPRHDSDSDQSPPSRRHDSDSDQSPPRSRHDSDQSPPRSRRHDSDSDQSPPRSHRHTSDNKHSHQQQKRRYDDSLNQSHKSKSKAETSDSDQSPPRKKSNSTKPGQSSNRKRNDRSCSDQSPPRKKSSRADFDQSSSRSKERDSSTSSSRKRNRPSRFEPADGKTNISLQSRSSITGTDKNRAGDIKAGKTLSGATAGLSSAKLMREEARKLKQKEMEAFHKIDEELLGRNAATVFRDKSGKRRNMKEEAEAEKEKQEKDAVENAKFEKWNKGMKQQELKTQALEDAMHEMSKPLTRYKDDEDLDSMLKEKDREGDPMLAFLKKKKSKNKDKKEKPRYSGPQPPPNRFGIWPGYRWDGVDRSTGFERQLFSKVAEKKAVRDIAYKWSVEDM